MLHIIVVCGADSNECRAQLQSQEHSQDREPKSQTAGRGKGPATNQSKTHLSPAKQRRRSVRGLFRWIPGILPSVSPRSLEVPTSYQLPTSNANRPDRESFVRRQAQAEPEAQWARPCHHRLLLLLSSFYNCRCKLFSHAPCQLLSPPPRHLVVAICNCCCRSRAMAQTHREGPKAKPKPIALPPNGEGRQQQPATNNQEDDCQTPSKLLASFVAASVSSARLKLQQERNREHTMSLKPIRVLYSSLAHYQKYF